MNVIGVDVGGTKIAAGVINSRGKLLRQVRYPTVTPQDGLLTTISLAIAEVEFAEEESW